MRVYFANGKTVWLDELDPRWAKPTIQLIGASSVLRLHEVIDRNIIVLRFYAEDES